MITKYILGVTKVKEGGLSQDDWDELIESEKQEFIQYIFTNWDSKHLNFSTNENGDFYYAAMQDAWNIWIDARLDLVFGYRSMGGLEHIEGRNNNGKR